MERKVATKAITFGVGRPRVPSHGQKCLDFDRVPSIGLASYGQVKNNSS